MTEASKIINQASSAYFRGSLDEAKSVLDSGLDQVRSKGLLEETLSICFFQGMLAAMEGLSEAGNFLTPATGAPHCGMLTSYLEGLAALARGKIEVARQNFDGLKREFQSEETRNSGSITSCFLANLGLAAVYFQERKYKASFAEYRQVLESLGSKETPPIVRVGMGMCAFRLQQPVLARDFLEREIDLHPDNNMALLALVVVYVDMRAMTKVTETVQKLRERLPENSTVLLQAGDLLYFRALALGNMQSFTRPILAIVHRVREFGSAGEHALADYQEGRLQLILGNLNSAQGLLEAAIHTLPSLLPARVHYVHLLLLKNQEADAFRHLQSLLESYPLRREVLQMIAVIVSSKGYHETAIRHSHRLIESVEPGDVNSWALETWCRRLNGKECVESHSHLVEMERESNKGASLEVMANIAVLKKDEKALETIVDKSLGASYLPSLNNPGEAPPALPMRFVPLVYNLALLKEKSDRALASRLYTFLVKTHCIFPDPYFRLHLMAVEDGHHKQGVAWLSLLIRVMKAAQEKATTGASYKKYIPVAEALIAVDYYTQKKYNAAKLLLDSACSSSSSRSRRVESSDSKDFDPVPFLCYGIIYLQRAQQVGKDNQRLLSKAKKNFELVLRKDPVNLLAAHGLGCCLGLEDEYDRCQALLVHVSHSLPNCSYVLDGHRAHISNAKTRMENYKQAIDYLSKEKNRTAAQDSSLGLCYAAEGRYEEACAVLLDATKKSPNQPMLLYNAALIHCAAFLHGVAVAGVPSMDLGLQLRNILQEGVTLMVSFFKLPPDPADREWSEGCSYLQHLGQFCRDVMKRKLQPLIAISIENTRQEEQDAQRWKESLALFRHQLNEQERKTKEYEEEEAKERHIASSSISERFKASGFSLDAHVLDESLLNYIVQETEYRDVNEEEKESEGVEGTGENEDALSS